MPTGTVKWFNNAKGYGFILPDQGGEDLFVHYTSILMDGYKTLKAGQAVSFEVVKGGKGLHATNIRTPDGQAANEKHPASANQDTSEEQTSDSGSSRLETYS
jgi:CspA family cold shock protein